MSKTAAKIHLMRMRLCRESQPARWTPLAPKLKEGVKLSEDDVRVTVGRWRSGGLDTQLRINNHTM